MIQRLYLLRGIFGPIAALVAIAALVMMPRISSPAPADDGSVLLQPLAVLQPGGVLERLSAQISNSMGHQFKALGLSADAKRAGSGDEGSELVLAGTLDRNAERGYVVRAWMVDRASGEIVWAARFESARSDSSGLGEHIAGVVAATTRCAVDERARARRHVDRALFALFLSACSATLQDHDDAVAIASRLLQTAPDIAGAHAMYALALAQTAEDSVGDEKQRLARRARAEARRAIAIDRDSAKAHFVLGLRLGDEPRFTERERFLRRAITLDPTFLAAPTAYLELLREVGRLSAADDAFGLLERTFDAQAAALPPLALLSAMRGDLPRSRRIMDRLDVVSPNQAPSVRWSVAVWWDGAARVNTRTWRRLLSNEPQPQVTCLEQYFVASARDKPRGLPRSCDSFEADWRVRLLAREGDVDGAYELMNANASNWRSATAFLFYPEMEAFRRDPRFMALADRLGLLAYWRETNAWPDFCSDETLPYDCR
jgi:hypothetical protein